MRLARLVAAGLAVGVITGFVTALLRPRPNGPIAAPLPPLPPLKDYVLDIRTSGPVTG